MSCNANPDPRSAHRTGPARAPKCVVTVVPAHDERDLLPRCLTALDAAARRCPVPVRTTVVLDACTDGTEAVIPEGVARIDVRGRNVGAARAAGFAASGCVGRDDVWFATTDADSVVPESWFVDQLVFWADHDAMVGTVRVDWTHHTAATRSRYERRYRRRDGSVHGHVHGANLGIRADVYGALGGFHAHATGEDVDLVDRLQRAGHRIAWDEQSIVSTSDRRDPRAPGGFGQYLHSVAAASGSSGLVVSAAAVEER
ncbi:glycosyl transferase family 2 [Rhodococcus sp. OK519]|uniref:glycosyltransferase n=1 Tax=Rhodococcus sp. OK519 TaxID=2135729 RepID=UPI000D3B9D7B|nr:glycosyl transferase family 2 [Rhodococcus sp. OK519]